MDNNRNKLSYVPGTCCGILSSRLSILKHHEIKELIYQAITKEGTVIYVYNSPSHLKECRKLFQEWTLDMEEAIETQSLILVSSTEDYIDTEGQLKGREIIHKYTAMVDRLRALGKKQIILYGIRDNFYDRNIPIEKMIAFHRGAKTFSVEKQVMILTKYCIRSFTEEHFLKLVSLHDLFILDDYEKSFLYDPKNYPKLEFMFKFLRNIYINNNQLHRENKELEFFNDLILEGSYKESKNALLNSALKKIASIIGFDFGYILSFVHCNGRNIVGQHNLPYGFTEDLGQMGFDKEKTLRQLAKGIAVYPSCRYKSAQRKYILKKYNIKSIIEIPLKDKESGQDPLGVILLFSTKDEKVFYRYVPFLETVRNIIFSLLKKQKENEEHQKQLIQVEKLKVLGELAGGIAHDFNNILATIMGFSEAAVVKTDDDMVKEHIKRIYEAAMDGRDIVNKIKTFTKKTGSSHKKSHNVNQIVESAIEMITPKWSNDYKSRGFKLEMTRELKSNCGILCNPFEIREVILNILLNAMDAMENGGKLLIRTYDKDERVFIEIEDTGMGIPCAIKEKVFEPFFSTKEGKGTGLGLSIAKTIIEDLDGELFLASEMGVGTKFTICLPKTEGISLEDTQTIPLQEFSSLRSLIVDDKMQVAESVHELLRALDVDSDIETTSNRVMERLEEKRYDFIMCDLTMPDVSGLEVVKVVKASYPDMKFILMTGWPDDIEDESGLIDSLLPKPFTLEDLMGAIQCVTNKVS